jgi:amidase
VLTCVSLLQNTCRTADIPANIERDNHHGLNLRAVIQTAPTDKVLHIASMLDDERARGLSRGLLHGIPMLVKDSMATEVTLGMDTGAGNFALSKLRLGLP